MINGQPFKYYGLIPIKNFGFLDMPSRVNETVYDWGDEIEPLVDEGDLFWGSRVFKTEFLYDSRLTNFTFKEVINQLSVLNDFIVLENQFGTFNVKLKEAIKTKNYNDSFVAYDFLFTEEKSSFISEKPVAIGGTGISIDEYDLFNDFGVLVKSVKSNDNIPSLKISNVTVETPITVLSNYRELKKIEFDCVIIRDGNEVPNINNLKKILSGSGLRSISYKNNLYSSFLTEGFNVSIKRKTLSFSLRLNVIN